MRRQRGIADWWIIAIVAVVLPSLLAGLAFAVKDYLEGIDERAFIRGQKDMETKYAQRDNAALLAANREKDAALERAQKLEGDAGKRQAEASERYQQGVRDGTKTTEDRIAANRAGTFKLRDPGATGAACSQQAGEPKTATGATGSDAKAGAELSGPFTEFLLRLTGEADDVTRQLAEAQAIIVSDRLLCNAP